MNNHFAIAMTVIITSILWSLVIVGHSQYDVEAYRQGYAEGKSGLPERWENAVGGVKTEAKP